MKKLSRSLNFLTTWQWAVDPDIWQWLPRIQSHRGYWITGCQQNSKDSIAEAFRRGYKMAEFDVRLTQDQQVILFHDDSYQNIHVEAMSFSDFYQLASKEYPSLVTLEELFRWFVEYLSNSPENQFCKLNIEIKSKFIFNGLLEKKVCELIERFQLTQHVLISSFNPFVLIRVRQRSPRIYRALLLTLEKATGNYWPIKKMYLNHFCRPHVLHLRFEDYFSCDEKALQRIPVPLVLWTVNEITERLDFSKIHGLISDSLPPESLK